MARFSPGFLNNLGNPQWAPSLFNLGSTIGKMPSQYREQQTRKANAEELSQFKRGTPEYFETVARQFEAAGEVEKATQLREAAEQARIRQEERDATRTQRDRETEDYERQNRERLAAIDYTKARLKGVQVSETTTPEEKKRAENMLRLMESRPDGAGAILAPAQDLISKTGISLTDTVSLAENFTKESVKKFYEARRAGKPIEGILEPIATGGSVKNLGVEVIGGVETLIYSMGNKVYQQPLSEAELPENVQEVIREDQEAVDSMRSQADRYDNAAKSISERSASQRGVAGTVTSYIAKQAGFGGDAELLRAELNMIQTTDAIAMLPPGVASDRDVKLVLDSTINLNDLNNEDAARYLRGMSKIKRAMSERVKARNRIRQIEREVGSEAEQRFDAYLEARSNLLRLKNGVVDVKGVGPTPGAEVVQAVEQKLRDAAALPVDQQAAAVESLRAYYGAAFDAVYNAQVKRGYFASQKRFGDFTREYIQ